jgi:hypothetical protein
MRINWQRANADRALIAFMGRSFLLIEPFDGSWGCRRGTVGSNQASSDAEAEREVYQAIKTTSSSYHGRARKAL